jgi:tRNA(Ile)-lysidine synthase
MYKKYKELVGNNFEQIARSIRYDFFLKMSKKYKVKTVLVAHHLDDFLETCIMQEEKKSIRLFYGMHENSEYKGLKIYRPLLKKKLTKKHIISYCAKNSIPFGIDETNFHDKYTRNKIRFRNQNLTPQQYKDMLKKYESYNKKNRKHYLKTIALFNA